MRLALLLLTLKVAIATELDFAFDHGLSFIKTKRPLLIAHRGASGIYPEHTRAAYEQAIEDGADSIECDIVLSKDLVPICNHDAGLIHTTNIEEHEEFHPRLANYTGEFDYYVIDFTLQELKTLKRVQSIHMRDPSFDGIYDIVTLREFISIAKSAIRTVVIYPEPKEPALHNQMLQRRGIKQRMEDIVVSVLAEEGYSTIDDPCIIQCFDENALDYIKNITDLPLVMLTWIDVTDETLQRWGGKYYGVGCWKEQIMRFWTDKNGYKNYISETTDFVEKARRFGLKIHVYTFRNEDKYLAWDFHQDPILEYKIFLALKVDGYFTDFPATLKRTLDNIYSGQVSSANSISRNLFVILLAIVINIY